jgi:hypothetical protein
MIARMEDKPSRGRRIATAVAKVVLLALSGLALAFGMTAAKVDQGAWRFNPENDWMIAGAAGIVLAVLIAFAARLRWSVLVLFLSMAFGLASCFANFNWHGG